MSRRFGVLVAGVSAALLLSSPVQAAKTLVYCSEGSPEIFNPALSPTSTSIDASLPIFDTLVAFEPGGSRIVPALAESWNISEDGLTYTFHLRHGVRWQSNAGFQPTREMNADDVLFSFERMWKADHPFHKVSGGAYDIFRDTGLPDLLAAITRIDDHTVAFTLKRVEATFLADMAMPHGSIQSKDYADHLLARKTPEVIDRVPIGTGPYQFLGYQKDVAIRYKAFDAGWHGKPPVDALVFSISPDAAVRQAKVKSGECHLMAYPIPADVDGLRQDPKLRVADYAGMGIGFVALNTMKKPFDDVRVRRAVNMAIDKDAIVRVVYNGAGVPAKGPLPPSMWSFNDDIVPYAYDQDGARRLLAEAGYSGGFETDLWAMPVQRPYNPNAKRMAEMMQADLAKVGIKARIVTYEWGEYRKRTQAGEHQMAMLGWLSDNGDPDNFLHLLLGCESARPGGINLAKWCDRHYDGLVVAAKRSANVEERTRLYRKAQMVVHDQAPWIPIAYPVQQMVMSNKVTGYLSDGSALHRLTNVGLAD